MKEIESSVCEEIMYRLKKVETDEQVKILYACESGSRAWGFPSINSDYDVRFIYLQKPELYLSIDEGRDVIEHDIVDEIDLNGWDIKKALKLLRKSNPPLLEWLQSPIVYIKIDNLYERFNDLLRIYYSPISCMHHYLNMAEKNIRNHLKGENVKLKAYFYVLRPLLACNWILNNKGPVPTEFEIMVNAIIDDGKLKEEIIKLINKKKTVEELSWGNRIPEISDFIEFEINRLSRREFNLENHKPNTDELNIFFRTVINDVWKQ